MEKLTMLSFTRKINILKMAVLLKAIYKLNVILIKFQHSFLKKLKIHKSSTSYANTINIVQLKNPDK